MSICNVFIVVEAAAAVVVIVACSSRNLGFYWTRRRETCDELLIKFFSASSSFILFHSPRPARIASLRVFASLSSLEIYSSRFFFSSFFASIFIDGVWRARDTEFAIFTWYFAAEMRNFVLGIVSVGTYRYMFARSRHKRRDLLLRDNTKIHRNKL